MPDVIFHIGLSKTGTTHLQQDVFPRFGALGKHSEVPTASHLGKLMRQLFTWAAPTVWREDEGREAARRIAALGGDQPIIYSDESLYRNNLFRGSVQAQNRGEPFRVARHLEYFAAHAWERYGQVKVVFVVRNQSDWLASRYISSLMEIDKPSQADFERKASAIVSAPSSYGGQVLYYDLLRFALIEALGESNVLPLLYENFSEEDFWDRLSQFSGIAGLRHVDPAGPGRNVSRRGTDEWVMQKPGYRGSQALKKADRLEGGSVLRHSARQTARALRSLGSRAPGVLVLSEALRADIRRAYRDANLRFQKESGVTLEGLGYLA